MHGPRGLESLFLLGCWFAGGLWFRLFAGVFGFDDVVGAFHEGLDFQRWNVAVEMKLHPVLLVHMCRLYGRTVSLPLLLYFLGQELHRDRREIIHIGHAKHVAADIKHQYRIITPREFSERRLLRGPLQPQAILPEILNIHFHDSEAESEAAHGGDAGHRVASVDGVTCVGDVLGPHEYRHIAADVPGGLHVKQRIALTVIIIGPIQALHPLQVGR